MPNFKFSNLYGSVYNKGNIVFTNDGYSVISPVGNRVTVFDLKRSQSYTLDTENRRNIKCVALAPDDNMLLTVDEEGQCVASSLKKKIPIHYFNFKHPVNYICFSPDNKYISACVGAKLQVFLTPAAQPQFQPFVLHKKFGGFSNKITCLDWSKDSNFICTGSQDMTIRILPNNPINNFIQVILRGFKKTISGCFFEENSLNLFAVDKHGVLIIWNCSSSISDVTPTPRDLVRIQPKLNEERISWERNAKHFIRLETTHITCSAYQKAAKILVIGHSNGIFSIYQYPDMSLLQQISVTNHKINSLVINPSSDWLALASSTLGQLVVWEWKNEAYVLKQQGHLLNMKCVSYSPDGRFIVSGGEDGKVKLWNTFSGFCFITFNEHTAPITGVVFGNTGQFVLSSSLDGTCRAFDLQRYRNFRTLVTTHPVQFSCIAIDHSGEIVCAGSVDDFDIYIWSMMTGRLLEIVSGHTSPVSTLKFIPGTSFLVSGSWDKSVSYWDVLNTGKPLNTLLLNSDVICVSAHPFKTIVAVSTTRSNITFWDFESDKIIGIIEGLKDLGLSRGSNDQMTAESSLKFRYFTSLSFSPDGNYLLACGKSKYVCLYDARFLILLHRFEVSKNQSFDGILTRLNSRKLTEAGPIDNLEQPFSDESEDFTEKKTIKIPGSLKSDISSRKTKAELEVYDLCFCPTGRTFICVTTEGLLVYSLDTQQIFDPHDIDSSITNEYIISLVKENDKGKALLCSVKLNETKLIIYCLESVKADDIPFIASSLPSNVIEQLLTLISLLLDNQTPFLEFYLIWCNSLLKSHGLFLKNQFSFRSGSLLALTRSIQKSLATHKDNIGQLCESNNYYLKYLCSFDFQNIKDEAKNESICAS